MNENFFPFEKKCAKCGKNFVAAPYHRFKEHGKWYCKWTCYNHRKDKKEKKNEKTENNQGSCSEHS